MIQILEESVTKSLNTAPSPSDRSRSSTTSFNAGGSEKKRKTKGVARTTKLMKVLQSEDQFEDFMQWMSREFSSEVLLSVIEFSQFKTYLMQYDKREDDEQILKGIKFYRKMPRSFIVHNGVDSESDITAIEADGNGQETRRGTINEAERIRVIGIAAALYVKYLDRRAELELNVSYSLRCRWEELHFRNYPKEDIGRLIDVVDKVIIENLNYVKQSFIRFDIDRSNKM